MTTLQEAIKELDDIKITASKLGKKSVGQYIIARVVIAESFLANSGATLQEAIAACNEILVEAAKITYDPWRTEIVSSTDIVLLYLAQLGTTPPPPPPPTPDPDPTPTPVLLTPEYRAYASSTFDRLKNLIKSTEKINHFIAQIGFTDDPVNWSLNSLPTKSDLVIIHHDATAILRGNNYGYMWRVDGVLKTQSGLVSSLEIDTLFTAPESTLDISHDVKVIIDVSLNINVSRDPKQISRGIITTGKVVIQGISRQTLYACSDMFPGDNGCTLQVPLFLSDFSRQFDWKANDRLILLSTAMWGNAYDSKLGKVVSFGKRDEVIEIASVSGNDINFKTPVVVDHTSEKDQTILQEIAARTSHIPKLPTIPQIHQWFGKPLVVNLTRNVLFTTTDLHCSYLRRPHITHLGDDVIHSWSEIQGFGRTNTTMPAQIDTKAPSWPIGSNVWGRFPLMIDRSGSFSMTIYPKVIGNSIHDGVVNGLVGINDRGKGSYGLGICVFNGNCDVETNIVHNTIGSSIAFVAGTETGVCKENTVINVWGQDVDTTDPIVKLQSGAGGVDLGRTGDGIFTASRLVHFIQNVGVSLDNAVIANMTRSSFDGDPRNDIYHTHTTPPSVVGRHYEYNHIDMNPILIEGVYAIACGQAIEIVKASPAVNHGYPAMIKNVLAWESYQSMNTQYTADYELAQPIIIGPRPRTDRPGNMENLITNKSAGITMGPNSYGMIVTNPYIARVARGIEIPNKWANATFTSSTTPTAQTIGNFVINAKFYQVTSQFPGNKAVVKTLPMPLSKSGSITTKKPGNFFGTVSAINISGTVTDSLGSNAHWPRFDFFKGDDQNFTTEELGGLLSVDGYYSDAKTSIKFVLARRSIRIRPTNFAVEIKIPVFFDSAALTAAQSRGHFHSGLTAPQYNGTADSAALLAACNINV